MEITILSNSGRYVRHSIEIGFTFCRHCLISSSPSTSLVMNLIVFQSQSISIKDIEYEVDSLSSIFSSATAVLNEVISLSKAGLIAI